LFAAGILVARDELDAGLLAAEQTVGVAVLAGVNTILIKSVNNWGFGDTGFGWAIHVSVVGPASAAAAAASSADVKTDDAAAAPGAGVWFPLVSTDLLPLWPVGFTSHDPVDGNATMANAEFRAGFTASMNYLSTQNPRDPAAAARLEDFLDRCDAVGVQLWYDLTVCRCIKCLA
jgi:hypothetical protein